MNGEIPIWVLQLVIAAALGVVIGYLLKKEKVRKEDIEEVKHFIIDVVMPYAQPPVKELLDAAIVVLKFYTGEITRGEALEALEKCKVKLAVRLGKKADVEEWLGHFINKMAG